jgi:hypothetical protein
MMDDMGGESQKYEGKRKKFLRLREGADDDGVLGPKQGGGGADFGSGEG